MIKTEKNETGVTSIQHIEKWCIRFGDIPETESKPFGFKYMILLHAKKEAVEINDETQIEISVPVGAYKMSYEDILRYPEWRWGVRNKIEAVKMALCNASTTGFEQSLALKNSFKPNEYFYVHVDGWEHAYETFSRMLPPEVRSKCSYWSLRHVFDDEWLVDAMHFLKNQDAIAHDGIPYNQAHAVT